MENLERGRDERKGRKAGAGSRLMAGVDWNP
jgi:hypothetical protein